MVFVQNNPEDYHQKRLSDINKYQFPSNNSVNMNFIDSTDWSSIGNTDLLACKWNTF